MPYSPNFMRKIEPTTAFKRDFKREGKGPRRAVLDTDLKQLNLPMAKARGLRGYFWS